MFFSFIIPMYNSESYIVETLNSILNQSYKDWEVILIDDKSTDKTISVCEGYMKTRKNIK